ncbi:hypothetical protein [Amycolatopsis anabasis]|uniref:hypothetical protein n=1 Tax=Amycolatopsis anabasis TaxID=1840409 RepID=UPI001FE6E6A9|nr:hypothetical protein [Amycolatopsis anabasis]
MTGQNDLGVDIPQLVQKIRDHRFEGYSDNALADEIAAFRSGDGVGSIGNAVDALKAVAGALADTDDALRTELGKLGVIWQGKAGGQAGAVLTEHAGFSTDANAKVNHSAEMIFAQGEAFSRTLHKLPDTAALRTGEGSKGYNLLDSLVSLLGFETDHAKAVRAGQAARQQAIDALNGYAKDSGDNLASTEALSKPESLQLVSAPTGSPWDPVGTPGQQPDVQVPDPSTTASSTDQVPGKGKGEPIEPGHTRPTPQVPPQQHQQPAPVVIGGKQTGVSTPPPQRTSPSSAPSVPAATTPHTPTTGIISGQRPGGGQPDQIRQPSPGIPGLPGTPPAPGTPPITGVVGTPPPDSQSGRTGGGPVGKAPVPGTEGVVGRVGEPPHGGRGGGGGDGVLGKGRTFGVAPQAPGVVPTAGPGIAAAAKVGFGANELGAGATALGAAGAGGAVSGEKERQGRGFGKGAPAGKPARPLPIGDLPEEEARVTRRSEKLSPHAGQSQRSLLERAAPQGARDEEDAEHVRKYGIDDKDLFADQRMVAPDLIGDDNAGDFR